MIVLWTLLGFALAIFLLVTIHEYGHYLVARACGVKVLTFSIGFGKAIYSWRSKSGVEFVLARIPLGGYVQMLDETEGPVAASEQAYAFNRQPLWKRTLVVLAGPAANFLLAIVLYWLVFIVGINYLVPIIGDAPAGSQVAKAQLSGRKITAINGHETPHWQAVRLRVLEHLGNSQPLQITTIEPGAKQLHTRQLTLSGLQLDDRRPDPLAALGFAIAMPPIEPVVGRVMSDYPAAKAGIQPGDRIIAFAGKPVQDWNQLVKYIRVHDGPMQITVKRDARELQFTLLSKAAFSAKGKKRYLLGITPQRITWPKDWVYRERYAPLQALVPAVQMTQNVTLMTLRFIGKLVTGQLSLQTVSGPVGIAVSAGQTLELGWLYYLHFLALVSISLGVLNLLPIPILDGGHLVFYLFEAFRRRPLSLATQELVSRVSFSFLAVLTIFAFYNDVLRLFSM